MSSVVDSLQMEGNVRVLESAATRVHTYTAPGAGYLVNTHVIETDTRHVVVDEQLSKANLMSIAGHSRSKAVYTNRYTNPS